jgi:DMSO/TMAO reductase YedYZ molybdopterin-dependent catalytic subunit
MMGKLSRRKLLTTGLATAGVPGLGVAAWLADRYGLIPPDHGGLYGPGQTLTYASQRLLTRNALALEFSPKDISIPCVNGDPPKSEQFQRLRAGGFADWRIQLDGMVSRPRSYVLSEIKKFPVSRQITSLSCEKGWSFIAEWTGLSLAHLLDAAGPLPQAKYVVYFPLDPQDPNRVDSIDMDEALHPQTLLTYGMNGAELPVPHGGPVRLRVPRQRGYKNMKWLTRLTVTDTLKGFGARLGSVNVEDGFQWYAGI